MEEQVSCQCGSGLEYDQCCGLYHSGEQQPATAESLMRSRFTAFAMRNEAYLLASWEGAKRPRRVDFSKNAVAWVRLDIVSTKKGGARDSKGMVQFKAFYLQECEEYVVNEISRFRKLRGRWYYLDGAVKSIAKVGEHADQELNALCGCGSGKKNKRCCGKK